MRIALIHPLSARKGVDQAYWAVSLQGQFKVKSAYDLLAQSHLRERDNFWQLA